MRDYDSTPNGDARIGSAGMGREGGGEKPRQNLWLARRRTGGDKGKGNIGGRRPFPRPLDSYRTAKASCQRAGARPVHRGKNGVGLSVSKRKGWCWFTITRFMRFMFKFGPTVQFVQLCQRCMFPVIHTTIQAPSVQLTCTRE
jgi:hypothetical protein